MKFVTTVYLLFGIGNVCVGITRKDHLHLLRPRCTSRCLSGEADRIVSDEQKWNNRTIKVSISDVMKNCLPTSRYKDCYNCLKPCQRPSLSLASCMEMCNGQVECFYSCAFLSDMGQDKMGYCTAPTDFDLALRVTYWAENSSYTLTPGRRDRTRNTRSCFAECRSDFDCLSNKKCCNIDCAPSCRRSTINKSWVPCSPSAQSLQVIEKKRGDLRYAEVHWQTKRKNGPYTVYLVQEKAVIAKTTPKFKRLGWNTIHETTETRVSLMHLKKGWMYKYRVAAVNINGTRGFVKETKPFALSGKPRPPPSPIRLELSRIKIRSGARFNVLAIWKLEKNIQSDLPIKGFYVTSHTKTRTSKIVKEHRRFVRFTKSIQSKGSVFWAAWVTGLKMFVPYQVSVTSAASWEDEILVSQRAINITFTYPPSKPSEVVRSLRADLPFLTWNGTVSVNITWDFWFTEAPADLVKFQVSVRSMTCFSGRNREFQMWTLEEKKHHLLVGLEFACEYEVSIQALYGTYRNQMSDPGKLLFSTPPCGLQQSQILSGIESPDDVTTACPNANVYKKKSDSFSRFTGLTTQLWSTFNHDFSAKLEWAPEFPEMKYDAVFMYVTFSDSSPLEWIYLPLKETRCYLHSLPPSRDFAVRFITVSKKRAVQKSTHLFSTPALHRSKS